MSHRACGSPIPLATLAEYWLGELDELNEARVEEHLLGCGSCSGALQELADLGGGIRALVRDGAVGAVVTDAFVERLAAAGLRLREYRVPLNGSVNCTVAPDDDVMVTRLQAPLAGVDQVDLIMLDVPGQGPFRLRDIPFDPATGEVVLTTRIAPLRASPAATGRMHLVAVARDGERMIGEYTFNHTPWPGH
jgi:hypothetical protein